VDIANSLKTTLFFPLLDMVTGDLYRFHFQFCVVISLLVLCSFAVLFSFYLETAN